MCAGAVQVNSLNSDNIIGTQILMLRGMDDYTEYELKALKRDTAFQKIFSGGVLHCRLSLRCQVAEAGGRLIYNGRPFNRSQWSWQPPKIIRMQGRRAKEFGDPRNNHPEISIYTEGGELLRLDACPCGGELLMDHNYNLYCANCNIIYK